MAKKSGTHTTTTQNPHDPQTQEWIKKIYEASQGAGREINPGVNPARNFYNSQLRGANLGFGALTGDKDAMKSMMNPFNEQVINRVEGDQSRLTDIALNAADSRATRAGVFGGDRSKIALGTAAADVARTGGDRMAALRAAGYDEGMARAAGLAGGGAGAAGGLLQLGEMSNPQMRMMRALREGYSGLNHGSSTTSSTPMQRGLGQGIMGGMSSMGGLAKLMGASNPWAWGAAGLGGLLGAF
jgi:hypothetical protein